MTAVQNAARGVEALGRLTIAEGDELDALAHRVHARAMAWLRHRGHVDERPIEARSNETEEPSALDACAAIAMQRKTLESLPTDASDAAPRLVAEPGAMGATDPMTRRPSATAGPTAYDAAGIDRSHRAHVAPGTVGIVAPVALHSDEALMTRLSRRGTLLGWRPA